MGPRVIRTLLTIVVNLVIVAAVLLAIRLISLFSGQIAAQGWAQAVIVTTRYVVIPFGATSIKTPYGGVFDVNAAITILFSLLAEWLLTGLRERV